jgi:hypothetical protein
LSNTILLFINWLTTAYNCPIITTYKSVSAILVLPTNPKVVAVVNIALGSILLTSYFFLLP